MYEVGRKGVETPPPAYCPKQINKSKQKSEEGLRRNWRSEKRVLYYGFFSFLFKPTHTDENPLSFHQKCLSGRPTNEASPQVDVVLK